MIKDIEKWRAEIVQAEDFRNKEFGEYSRNQKSMAGYNIEYFERGFGYDLGGEQESDQLLISTLNLYHALTKNIVPSLHYQNPKVLTFPTKSESQDTAPVVGQTVNHYYKNIEADDINNHVTWDAYVLGYGVSKIGYATQLGVDLETEKEKKTGVDRLLEKIGIKKKQEEEVTNPEIDFKIESESPYISYVSPFRFGIDPRATSIHTAMYVYEVLTKTVKQMKENGKYKNTKDLRGSEPDIPSSSSLKMSQTELDDFRTVELYEIHYRQADGVYILVLSKDSEEWREHYHEKSIYKMKGWQYELLTFNKHGHKLYPISDLTKIRALQDRFTSIIDSILEQVDRFVPKIACNVSDVTEAGMKALRDGGVGAIVETSKDPNSVFKELSLTQYKQDLAALSEEIINLVTIQTGLTKAQLTGVSNTDTATEAQITQGGQTIRMNDMAREVNKYLKRQATKLWQVVKQFVELEELQLINGVSGIDEQTGLPKYNWLTIDTDKAEAMRTGEYDFDIEVGSTQKPDLPVIRKQFENMFNILAKTDVIALMQQQGKKVDIAELLRLYLQLFPEMVKDIGRIIQNIGPDTKGLVDPMAISGKGGTTAGSNFNALEAQAAQPMPTAAGVAQ